MSATRSFLLLAVIPCLMLATGCVVGTAKSAVYGEYVSRSTTAEIVPGETTTEWLTTSLGPPSSRCVREDGSERLMYRFTVEDRAKLCVFPFVGVSVKSERLTTVEIEARDGIVQAVQRHHT